MQNQQKTNFDVLIAGGGPSGAALGILLLEQGFSCCIVDKSAFPREKLCGGLVTAKTKRLLFEITKSTVLPGSDSHEVSRIAFFYRGETLMETDVLSPFTIVRRRNFDDDMIRRFTGKGGVLLEKCEIASVDRDANCARLKTGETLRYRVLVGADGVYSKMRTLVDERPLPSAFCCETFVPKEHADLGERISMHFGVVPSGYAWVFPQRDAYAIGFGGFTPKGIDYKKTMAHLLQSIGVSADDIQIRGMHVPCGHFVEKPVRDNILLVGDAAGLVDSMTGEGLYYALFSAKAAAAAIGNHLRGGDRLDGYAASLSPVHAHIQSATRVQRFFYNRYVQNAIFGMAQGRTNLVRYAVENVVSQGDMTWGEAFTKYFGQKLFGR